MMKGKGKVSAFLLDLVFPNRCPLCDRFIKWNECICEECSGSLPKANEFICRKCGKKRCTCREKPRYDMAFASFFYSKNQDPVRNAMLNFKLKGEINIAEYAARDIAYYMQKEGIPKPDMVIPVPMGKKKRSERGHNQAELFAACIGRNLDIPVDRKILFKSDTEDEQHNYGRKERKSRVKGLFYAENTDLSGITVILCDDIMTTGSTINECAFLLKEMGAKTVISAVCAVTERSFTMEEGT